MIIKNYELNKLRNSNIKLYLLYGENEGHKNEAINEYFILKFEKNIYRYEEDEILKNYNSFVSNLLNKSFFEEEKIIIISRGSEKILKLVEEIVNNKIENVKLVINCGSLDKKSKIRTFFEKNKNTICIPFYADELKTLKYLANDFFKKKKISISQETVNYLIERSKGDRINLKNELIKIENFSNNKSKISTEELLKLTNLAENYSVSELIDNCLSKNSKKTVNILNENNYSTEDCILIIRTMLMRAKRLLKLQEKLEETKNIEETISAFKPSIFWKDKEIVKEQIKNWNIKDTKKLIYKINEIEILIKKNSSNSLHIISDFILTNSNKFNNYSL